MSFEFYYRTSENELCNLAMGKWLELRKLLPLLEAYLNRAVATDWSKISTCNVTVGTSGANPVPQTSRTVPDGGLFDLKDLISERYGCPDEVYLCDAMELARLFYWCEFLASVDGAFQLYAPCHAMLRQACCGFERFCT